MRRFGEVALENGLIHVWDALRFGATTGFRRDDLVSVNFSQVSRFAIVKKAKKRSRGRRRFTTMPRIPELDALLEELATRQHAEGVTTVLVAADGRAWHPDTLTKAIAKVRDLAGIVHVDEETGERRQKHLHDVRGTFATKLMVQTDLSDQEIAEIMGWSPQEVARIRKVYVDQRATIVAIGQRIARGVNP
jgi:integrase